jgi:O-antigen/teichoic acid export membrane protein
LEECKYKFQWDKKVIYPMLSFSGWDLWVNMGFTLKNNGINIILNLFFLPIINAAYGIAIQVSNAFNTFAINFLITVKPQIIKYYAEGKIKEMETLLINATKFSFLLISVFSLPVLCEMDFILNLWLKRVPVFTNIFCQLSIVMILLNALYQTISYVIHATGKMKTASLVTGSLYLLIPIISYILFKLENRIVYTPLLIAIVFFVIVFFVKLSIIHSYIPQISIIHFIKKTVLIVIFISAISAILPLFIHFSLNEGWLRLILVTLSSTVTMAIATYYIALNKQMKQKVVAIVSNKIRQIKR